jgi:hypothetical protein
MEQADVKSFDVRRDEAGDRYAGQVRECPYPPGGVCVMCPEMPAAFWCTAKKCWRFGEHLREWAEAHPVAENRITYTDKEFADMLAYANRKAETTGAAYAGR